MSQLWIVLELLISAFCFQYAASYKPVILVHGVRSDGPALDELKGFIQEASPGTNVTSIDIYDQLTSFVPLDVQLPAFIDKVKSIMAQAKEGVHLICHSQGGLICRGIIETVPEHNVHTFITLSTPLMGQFGIPPYWTKSFPFLNNKSRDELSEKIMYKTFIQDIFSVSNYWRDPRAEYFEKYEKYCKYLPVIQNNPKAAKYIPSVAMAQKKNFLKITKMVSIGGPDDGVINPWYSSVFGYLSADAKTRVPMTKQQAYLEDWFGLRSLDERGGLTVYEIPHVKHENWHRNKTVFDFAINKWLT